MKKNDSNRRKFLRNTLSGSGAIAGVAALGVPSSALAKSKGKATKKAITRDGKPVSPEAIFSPAIQLGQLLFVSGQGAHDPTTHKVEEGPISSQVRQCLENVKTVLEAAGSSMDRALKCTVFLKEIGDYQEMNKVYHSFFTKDPPARSTVAVKDLPGDSPVEIECIAYVD